MRLETGARFDEGTATVWTVRGAAMRTAPALFAEFAAQLDLPAWFGRNWDALAECLLDAVPPGGAVLRVLDGDQVLTDEPDDALAILIRALPTDGLRVVLRVPPEHETPVRSRWQTVGAAMTGR